MNNRKGEGAAVFALCLLPFILLATANSAGYRFGASDQAFYTPAVLERIDPSLFPRDSDLIRSQASLTLMDDVIAPIARITGLQLPALFVVLQLLTLGMLAFAAKMIGESLYATRWTTTALTAALTLRHAIPRSGTNTLEGYFHPRQLSFALGALAVASFLRGRYVWVLALMTMGFALHPTTGLWFTIWLSVAVVSHLSMRLGPHPQALSLAALWLARAAGAAAAILGTAGVVWAFNSGPLAGRLAPMDSEWLQTLASKDYLFPLKWPLFAWLVNLAYAPLVAWIYWRRRAAGRLVPRETALVAGCLSLLAVFAAILPFNGAAIALAVQLQPARMFWMLDFMAIIYIVWALAEGVAPSSTQALRLRSGRARIAAIVLVLLSTARGTYIMLVEFPERRLAQADISNDDWGRVMAWARASDPRSGWLAAPDHAIRYGTSVRVAGHRDVFVEAIKDEAVGMYDRAVAIRTRDRARIIGDFDALSPQRARQLAAEYGMTYLVTEQPLDLPVAFQSGRIRVYELR